MSGWPRIEQRHSMASEEMPKFCQRNSGLIEGIIEAVNENMDLVATSLRHPQIDLLAKLQCYLVVLDQCIRISSKLSFGFHKYIWGRWKSANLNP
jgi:hypothetical protein